MQSKTVLEIRSQAEEVMRRRGIPKLKRSSTNEITDELLQELHVHQIELELQNEELRRSQEELQHSKDRFSSLYDFAPVCYLTVDEQATIIEANITAAKTLEVERKTLIGLPMTRFIDHASQDDFYLVHRRASLSSEPESGDIRLRTQSGKTFDAHFEYAQHKNLHDGKIVYRCAIVDISKQKQTERALRQSEQKFRTLIEGSSEGFLLLDERGTIIEWNKAAEEITGLQRSDVVGMPAWEIQSRAALPERRASARIEFNKAIILDAITTGNTTIFAQPMEVVFVRYDGKVGTLEQRVFPIKTDAGYRLGMVFSDITERKRTEEILRYTQKMESLGVLAGGVAHDFNNLLQAMLGQTTVALKKLPAESAARENLEKAVKATERAAHLTHQLLAYSGRGRFEIRALDLNSLVQENMHLLHVSIPKHVRINAEFSDDLPHIMADPGQIQQIIMNLIINAGEAIGDQPGEITVVTATRSIDKSETQWWQQTGKMSNHSQFVILEISDNGSGMTEETQRKIFDPFFTTKFTGRGLGLAAVLGIVRGHDGGLKVESIAGKGTKFSLAFPAAGEEMEVNTAMSVPREMKLGGTLLLIDDEDIVRDAVKDILEMYGLHVLLAPNGEVGIELYQQHRDTINLVVLDLSMPGIGGEETFRRLRVIDPNVQVILSSGYSESEATANLTGQGLAGFIHKPYRPEDMILKIRQQLEAK